MSNAKETKVVLLTAKELLLRSYETTHARMGDLIEKQKLLTEEMVKLSRSLIEFKSMIIYCENQEEGKEQ